ncbi:hypothetical protein AYK21_02785 [Thermoplasmatales archaeon SG8-52-2]|nr:MAG: hypothetical protein AYK21_02785 [Thermoplasmatales archaeon SG8-52-2]
MSKKSNRKPKSKKSNLSAIEDIVDKVILRNKEKLNNLHLNNLDFEKFSLKNKEKNTIYYLKKKNKTKSEDSKDSKLQDNKTKTDNKTSAEKEIVKKEQNDEKNSVELFKAQSKPSTLRNLLDSKDFDMVVSDINSLIERETNKDEKDRLKKLKESKHELKTNKSWEEELKIESKDKVYDTSREKEDTVNENFVVVDEIESSEIKKINDVDKKFKKSKKKELKAREKELRLREKELIAREKKAKKAKKKELKIHIKELKARKKDLKSKKIEKKPKSKEIKSESKDKVSDDFVIVDDTKDFEPSKKIEDKEVSEDEVISGDVAEVWDVDEIQETTKTEKKELTDKKKDLKQKEKSFGFPKRVEAKPKSDSVEISESKSPFIKKDKDVQKKVRDVKEKEFESLEQKLESLKNKYGAKIEDKTFKDDYLEKDEVKEVDTGKEIEERDVIEDKVISGDIVEVEDVAGEIKEEAIEEEGFVEDLKDTDVSKVEDIKDEVVDKKAKSAEKKDIKARKKELKLKEKKLKVEEKKIKREKEKELKAQKKDLRLKEKKEKVEKKKEFKAKKKGLKSKQKKEKEDKERKLKEEKKPKSIDGEIKPEIKDVEVSDELEVEEVADEKAKEKEISYFAEDVIGYDKDETEDEIKKYDEKIEEEKGKEKEVLPSKKKVKDKTKRKGLLHLIKKLLTPRSRDKGITVIYGDVEVVDEAETEATDRKIVRAKRKELRARKKELKAQKKKLKKDQIKPKIIKKETEEKPDEIEIDEKDEDVEIKDDFTIVDDSKEFATEEKETDDFIVTGEIKEEESLPKFYDFDEKIRGPVRRDLKSRKGDFRYQKKKIKEEKQRTKGKGFLGFGKKDLEKGYSPKGKAVVGVSVPRRGLFSRRKRSGVVGSELDGEGLDKDAIGVSGDVVEVEDAEVVTQEKPKRGFRFVKREDGVVGVDRKVSRAEKRKIRTELKDIKDKEKQVKDKKAVSKGLGFFSRGRKGVEPKPKGKDIVSVPRGGLFSRRKRFGVVGSELDDKGLDKDAVGVSGDVVEVEDFGVTKDEGKDVEKKPGRLQKIGLKPKKDLRFEDGQIKPEKKGFLGIGKGKKEAEPKIKPKGKDVVDAPKKSLLSRIKKSEVIDSEFDGEGLDKDAVGVSGDVVVVDELGETEVAEIEGADKEELKAKKKDLKAKKKDLRFEDGQIKPEKKGFLGFSRKDLKPKLKGKGKKAVTSEIDQIRKKTTITPMFRVDNIALSEPVSKDEAQLLEDKIKIFAEKGKSEKKDEDVASKAIELAADHIKEKEMKVPKDLTTKKEIKKEEIKNPSKSATEYVKDNYDEHLFFDEEENSSKGWSPKLTKSEKDLAIEEGFQKPGGLVTEKMDDLGYLELPEDVLRNDSTNLSDLGFSINRWEELDFYSLNEPFAYVEILREKDTLDKCYFLVEIALTKEEQKTLTFIKETMSNMSFNTDEMEEKGFEKYLLEKLDQIIFEYNLLINEESRKKIFYYIGKSSVGLGKIDPLMKDPNIEDISCDGANVPIFLYHRKFGSLKSNVAFNNEDELSSFVHRLAQKSGKQISIAEPMLDATMPDGSRIQMTLSDEITAKGSTFTIRKFRADPFSPPDIVEFNTMSSEMVAYMWVAIENGVNTLFAGGTASGKTTALNAVSLFIPRESKIVSIEETREINLPHPNWIPGVARSGFGEVVAGKVIGEIDLYDLMKAALRQRPEYILVGEIRGREAYVLFQAMATGHATYSTVHADSAQSLIHRLEGKPINIPRVMLQSLDVVCLHVITRVKNMRARRCKQIIEIIDIDPTTKEILTNEVFRWDPVEDKFVYSGKSYMLERVRGEKDLTREEMTQEINRRRKIIEWMNKNNVREFRGVAKIVSQYAENPDEVMKTIEKGVKKNEK